MSTTTIPGPSTEPTSGIDYSKYIPLTTAGLILLGVSRLLFYYQSFGINVLAYLEFNEIITSFFDVVVINVLLFVIGWIIVLSLSIRRESANQIFNASKQRSVKTIAIASLAILLILFTFAIFQMYNQKRLLWLYIISVTISVFFFLSLIQVVSKNYKVKILKDLIVISIILILSEILTLFIATNQYWRVKYGKKYIGTTIVFNNATYMKDRSHTFVSDSSDFYIGQTNKYIFIYHLIDDFTSVYPVLSVIQIDIKTNKHKMVY